jgi:rare lipoprotein A (peptidoglycan hydrolase)
MPETVPEGGGIMARWLVVLSLAVMQCPAVAVASPGSLDGHARLAEAVVTLKSAGQVNELQAQERQVQAEEPQAQKPQVQEPQAQEPQAQEPQAQEPQAQVPQAQVPPKSTGAAGCNAGRRVVAASYGQGQRTTSSGDRFDPKGMTAAHRTLPFGTRVTVTNPKTGKSVVVVVNDRGPSTRRIDIDISIAAAKLIGLDGTAAVCME